MCGIAGFVNKHIAADPAAQRRTLERMAAVIGHRGPNATNFHTDEHAFLGHLRLSIVDLAAGHQPMPNEDESAWIIYNGEIFNHAALRPALEQAGHRYRTRCDTETILHAYEQHGPRSVDLYRGMFAYAIWDRRAKKLFCARDRLGIKPFYYFANADCFVFASEIKALLEHPAISARLNREQMAEYVAFGYGSGEETLFAGIKKLMPGHTVEWSVAQPVPRITQYWDVPAPPAVFEERSDAEWIGDLRARLEETVEMRLMADVPLGMFLSGGVDSSAIAALVQRSIKDKVRTFSVGYREEAYSELGYARQVAERLGTLHHEVTLGMDEFFGALPKLIWHEDEPISWPSSVSLYFVSKLAASKVVVVLTGEGSDELFAGYERYRHYQFNAQWLERYRMAVPGSMRSALRGWIASTPMLRGDLRRKLMHTFLGREESLESLQLDNFYCSFGAEDRRTITPGLQGNPYASYRRYWDRREGAGLLDRMLYADQKTYLVELLMKQDQMSMACSIESRVPLLDHTLVEFSTRIPSHLKIRNGESKWILKKAVEDLLPHDIIYRKKMGFPTPLRAWLRAPEADRFYKLLAEPEGVVAEIVDPAAMAALIDRHRRGLEDATDRIWRLLNLKIWGDTFLAGRREPLLSESLAGVPE